MGSIASLAQNILPVAQRKFQPLQGVILDDIIILASIPGYPDQGENLVDDLQYRALRDNCSPIWCVLSGSWMTMQLQPLTGTVFIFPRNATRERVQLTCLA